MPYEYAIVFLISLAALVFVTIGCVRSATENPESERRNQGEKINFNIILMK